MATVTTLHDLYSDILLCIFEYFTVHEIYEIFSQVIPNLTLLLRNSRIRLHLRQSTMPPIDPAQVISIKLKYLPRLFSPSPFEFINLRSLILHDMEDPQSLIKQPLFQLLEIFYLNISLRYKPDIVLQLLPLIIQLSKLKSYTIIYPSSYFVLQKDALILQRSSNTIRNIKLDFKCSMGSLEKLLSYVPCLRRLQATFESNSVIDDSFHMLLFPSIQYLCLSWEYIPFRDILTFCGKMVNLKKCIFNVNDHRNDLYTFNPNGWHQFIECDHVLLKRLIVNMKCKPSPANLDRIPHPLAAIIKDPYFQSINFKFDRDHWGGLVVEGDYIKLTEGSPTTEK
jgi:hypothetical protein